jgi:hypothetical protein
MPDMVTLVAGPQAGRAAEGGPVAEGVLVVEDTVVEDTAAADLDNHGAHNLNPTLSNKQLQGKNQMKQQRPWHPAGAFLFSSLRFLQFALAAPHRMVTGLAGRSLS